MGNHIHTIFKVKKKKIFILSFVLMLILSLGSTMVLATGLKTEDYGKNEAWYFLDIAADRYEFPVTPLKTPEEWGKLETISDKFDALQIPEDILKNMSTAGLVATCLDYPLFGNMFAYNSYHLGLQSLIINFNGLRELFNRDDCASALLELYKNLSYESIINSDDPYYTIRIRYLDYLMSYEGVLSNLNHSETLDLLRYSVNAFNVRSGEYKDIFSPYSTIHLTARVLQSQDKNVFEESN